MNMVSGAPARGRLGLAALFFLFLAIAFPSRTLAQNVGVQVKVTNDWGSGFTAEVKVTNNSAASIPVWTLEFDLAGNIVNLWNGVFTKNTTHYTVKNASWNGTLAPGGSATFGFQANYSGGRPNPSNCIFNGGACSFGGDVVPPPAGGLKVNWKIANDWGSGYQADVIITNSSGVAVSGWNLQFDLGGIVSNIWNASLATSGNHRTVQNAAWNGGIGAGGSVSFGFTGSYSGSRPDPSNCNINGSACVFEGLTPGGGTPPPPPPPPIPPSISIVSPANNTTVSGTAVSIVAQTGGDGITSVQFFVDGASIGQDTSSPYSISWNTTTISDGIHSLTARANTSSQSVTSNAVSVNVQQPVLPPLPPPGGVEGFLSISGSQLLDSGGNPVRLTGVNWFGFETHNRVVHGLWSRDYRSMLHQIHDLGFNVLRIPWSNGIFDAGAQATSITFSGADPYDGRSPMNQPLAGKTPIQILDLVIEEAGRLGLKVFLDNHSRRPDGFANEDLWYTQDFSEQQWINHWVVMAQRYKNNPTVIGFDLNNEPHGRSTWGSGETASDWAAAAERCAAAIHAVHPDALIIVEGIESYNGANYWWGGNLRGVRNRPLNINPAKLIYSPHDYSPEVYAQPWFFDPSYPNNLNTVWDEAWGFIRRENRGYLLLGEFGIQSQTSHSGKSLVWIQRLVAYMGSTMSWTFWTINPNSGDTGGILQDNWVSVNQWKMDILRPYLAPQFPAPSLAQTASAVEEGDRGPGSARSPRAGRRNGSSGLSGF